MTVFSTFAASFITLFNGRLLIIASNGVYLSCRCTVEVETKRIINVQWISHSRHDRLLTQTIISIHEHTARLSAAPALHSPSHPWQCWWCLSLFTAPYFWRLVRYWNTGWMHPDFQIISARLGLMMIQSDSQKSRLQEGTSRRIDER